MDEPGLSETNFACFINKYGEVQSLFFQYNIQQKFLELKYYDSQGNSVIDMFTMSAIYFGGPNDGAIQAICGVDTDLRPHDHYIIKSVPNLKVPSVEVLLEATYKDDLRMNITQYEEGMMRVKWAIDNSSHETFEVPSSIASTENLSWCDACTLEQAISFRTDDNASVPIVTVKNPQTGKVVLSVKNTAISDNLMLIDGTA